MKKALRKSCPIPGCNYVYTYGISGWSKHILSLRLHPAWHPNVEDGDQRKRLFAAEFPTFFATMAVPSRRVVPAAAVTADSAEPSKRAHPQIAVDPIALARELQQSLKIERAAYDEILNKTLEALGKHDAHLREVLRAHEEQVRLYVTQIIPTTRASNANGLTSRP